MSITIHGAGCVLMDYLYRGIDFADARVARLLRKRPGDGGLTIGGLVFADALEEFAGEPIGRILADVTDGRAPDRQNAGGPAIVSLVNTAQLCESANVRFFGAVGDDETGDAIRSILAQTPVDLSAMIAASGPSPATYVLSDPDYDGGHGERMFINRLGVAARVGLRDLGKDFVQADIVQLGGTALTPALHESLPILLRGARASGALTVVNTVYDFRAELTHPGRRWTLGGDESYPLIDLLVTDAEEAARLTERGTPEEAVDWFLERGVGAAIVTNGPRPVVFAATEGRFARVAPASLPVMTEYAASPEVREANGDTTGCGDNFVGGVVAGVAEQLETAGSPSAVPRPVDLIAAVRLGIASGAFCMTHLGGTYIESRSGEKRRRIEAIGVQYDSNREVTR